MIASLEGGPPLLELERACKKFGGVAALDQVSFDLRRGEVHALLGENGAGKSTLIKLLAGIHRIDSGAIRVDDQEVSIRGVNDADRLGIRVIHQELSLAPNLSVAENIFLGREPTADGLLGRSQMRREALALVRELGLKEIEDVDQPVSELNNARQQLVEIARALSCSARVLILDEPTSSLSEAETAALFVILRRLRSQGVGIIYISHRLEEILQLADRITVLRDGRAVGTQPRSSVDRARLVEWMVGRKIVDHFPKPVERAGAIALEIRDVRNPQIRGVTLQLRYGQVLGMAGLVGSGRTELARAIFGLDRIDSGQILLDGKPVPLRGPADAIAAGIVLVPEDRKLQGLVMGHSIGFNIALPWLRLWLTGCMPNWSRRSEIISRALGKFRVKATGPDQAIDALSGGNQQKVLLGRWMERPPKVLILDEPTRGIDVSAREEIYLAIGSLVEQGMAVLLISSDLEEVRGISHRIAIYADGRVLDVVDAADVTAEQIMHELTGAGRHAIR